jgi:hypothetical protein
MIILLSSACTTRSDDGLLRQFHDVRSDLDAVRKLVPTDDAFLRIAESWSEPEMPGRQLLPIRAILARAGIREGLLIRGGVCLFLVQTRGMVGRGWTKGFAYVPALPQDASLRRSLDDPRALPSAGLFLRPIPGEQHWYLFVDR